MKSDTRCINDSENNDCCTQKDVLHYYNTQHYYVISLLTGSVIIAFTCDIIARDANVVKIMTHTPVPNVGKGGASTVNTTNSPYKINKYVITVHTIPHGSHTNQYLDSLMKGIFIPLVVDTVSCSVSPDSIDIIERYSTVFPSRFCVDSQCLISTELLNGNICGTQGICSCLFLFCRWHYWALIRTIARFLISILSVTCTITIATLQS